MRFLTSVIAVLLLPFFVLASSDYESCLTEIDTQLALITTAAPTPPNDFPPEGVQMLEKSKSTINGFHRRCFEKFARAYKASGRPLTVKEDMQPDIAESYATIFPNFKAALFTDTGVDQVVVEKVIEYAGLFYAECSQDHSFITGRPTDLATATFREHCKNMKDLKDRTPEQRHPTLAGVATPTDATYRALSDKCQSGGEDATPLNCARACLLAGDTGEHCTFFGDALQFHKLADIAKNCAREINAGRERSSVPACNNCLLDYARFNSASMDATDTSRCTVAEERREETAPRPIVTASAPVPVPKEEPEPEPEEETNLDDTNPSPMTEEDKTAFNNMANSVAADMFGTGNEFDYDRQNPSGSLNIPSNSDIASGINSGSNIPRVSGQTAVSAVAPRTFDPRLNFPGPRQDGLPGGNRDRQAAGAGGQAGGGAFAGGGAPPLGNRGAAGNQAGGQAKKRRRGGSANSLNKIAENIGKNSFLGADRGGGPNSPAAEKKVAALDKKYRDKINQNKKGDGDPNSLRNALNDSFNGARGVSRDLILKASYFPDSTDVYIRLQERSDHLGEQGI